MSRIQVRTNGMKAGRLHIQGIGPVSINRDYGVALELRAPNEVTEWLVKQEPTHKSAASKSVYYVCVDLYQAEEHPWMIIHGDVDAHDYGEGLPSGMALGLDMDSPQAKSLLDFAQQSMLVGEAALPTK